MSTRQRLRAASEWAIRTARRAFEVVDTDVLEWKPTTSIPDPRPGVRTDVLRVDPRVTDMWREIVPRAWHKKVAPFRRRSDIGYLAVVEGQFAGWVWISRRTHRDPWSGLRIRLAAGEAYSYALSVGEEFRPQGIGAVLIARMLSDARSDRELKCVYGWVDRRNRQSVILLRMVFGFKQTQSIKRFHLLRRFGGQVPFSARPRFGPLSRAGRHAPKRPGPAAAPRA